MIIMTHQPFLKQLQRTLLVVLVGSFAWLQVFGNISAQAETQKKYIDAEGRDLTAVVECLPEDYGKGNLEKAIAKFGNDYLERVLRLKENTEDYKVSEDEKQLQECLKSKGIRPKS